MTACHLEKSMEVFGDSRLVIKSGLWSQVEVGETQMISDILSRDQYLMKNNMKPPLGSSIKSTLWKSKYFGESFRPSGNIQKNNEWIFTMEVCKLITETSCEDEQLIYSWNKYSKLVQEEEELWNWRHSIPIGVWHFNKEKILSITKLILSDFHKVTSLRKRNAKSHTLWQSNIWIREVEWSW